MKGLYALVGMKHRGTEALVQSLPDREPLKLVREPRNPHDGNAIQVWARGTHLGYIKGSQNRDLARWMDEKPDVPVFAFLSQTNGERWPMVETNEHSRTETHHGQQAQRAADTPRFSIEAKRPKG